MKSLISILCLFSFTIIAQGAPLERVSLGYGVSYFEDSTHQVTLENILSGGESSPVQWRHSQQLVPNFGFSASSFWLKVTVDDSMLGAGKKMLELEYPLMDYIEFYIQDKDQRYQKLVSGDSFPFSNRTLDHRFFAVPVTVELNQSQDIYIRLTGRDTIIAPLQLWNEEAFFGHYENERYWLGIYYGAILSIVFYSLVCWLVLKNGVFIFNVLMIAMFCLIQLSLDGVGNALVWGDYPEFAKRIRPFAISLLGIGALELTKRYFQRERVVPASRVLYGVICLGSFLGMLGAVVLPFRISIQLSMVSILIALIPVVVTGAVELKTGSLISRYFAAGWIFLILGGVANVMRGFGLLPVNIFTVYGAQMGALSTMLLLTFGFMDRIRVLQQQVERVHKKALAQERLANRELDEKVKQRTEDLELTHQVIMQKNEAFKVLLETSAQMDHEQSLQSLLDLTVSKLVRVFPKNQFALLLNDDALEEHIEPIFHDVHFQQQKFLMRYHEHLLSMERQGGEKKDREKVDESLFDDLNVAPVRQGKDLLLGHIIMSGKTLNQSDRELLMVFVDQLSSFLKNKVLHDQLELLANKDILTGTYSRAYFESFLAKLVKEKDEKDIDFTLLLIDVNGLKYVNDVHGHNDGDLMLCMVANFLMENVRGNDVVCRLGGDEFVIALKGTIKESQFLVDKLLSRQQDMTLLCREGDAEETLPVRFSLGSASSSDHDCNDLLKVADQQMYAQKTHYYKHNPNALTRDS